MVTILLTRVLEGDVDLKDIQNEINRTLNASGVDQDKVINIQVEELQEDRAFKLYVVTK